MKKTAIKIFFLLCFTGTFFTSCKGSDSKTENKNSVTYQCPMDCENGKTYDKPGVCPVCEMELEKK